MKKSLEDRIAERWKMSAAQTDPESRREMNDIIPSQIALHQQYRENCIADVIDVLKETIVEFVAAYHLQSGKEIPLGRAQPLWPDHAYYFGRSLYDMRSMEFATGKKNITNIREYFPEFPLSDLERFKDPSEARDFIEDREIVSEFCKRDMKLFRSVHSASPDYQKAAEIVSRATHPVLAVLTHDPKQSLKRFLSNNAKMAAEYLIYSPDKSHLVEQGFRKKAESFVDEIPDTRSLSLFISRINQTATTLRNRAKNEKNQNTTFLPPDL